MERVRVRIITHLRRPPNVGSAKVLQHLQSITQTSEATLNNQLDVFTLQYHNFCNHNMKPRKNNSLTQSNARILLKQNLHVHDQELK